MAKKKLAVMDNAVEEEKILNQVQDDNKVEETPAEEAKPERKKILGANRGEKILGTNKEAKAEKKAETPKAEAKKEEKAAENTKPTHSKKYLEVQGKVERNKNYPVAEAVTLAKETNYTKFDGTLEIHINSNIKNLRGLVSLPFASGKKLRIIAFGKGAEDSGADIIGDDNSIKEIEKSRINFDVIVTTPEWMPRLARFAKILGPKGMMPNPKNGTVTDDLKKAVTELQSGKVEYKTEKVGGVMHLSLGKLSQPNEELEQNLKTLLTSIGKSKIKKAVISGTMSPGIRLDVSSI
jgi:large subunit ribosomal protein L1